MRYAAVIHSTNQTYYVYGVSDEDVFSKIEKHLKRSAIISNITITTAGHWEPSSGTIANDPEPPVFFEGSVVARSQKSA